MFGPATARCAASEGADVTRNSAGSRNLAEPDGGVDGGASRVEGVALQDVLDDQGAGGAVEKGCLLEPDAGIDDMVEVIAPRDSRVVAEHGGGQTAAAERGGAKAARPEGGLGEQGVPRLESPVMAGSRRDEVCHRPERGEFREVGQTRRHRRGDP